ncbi:MAG: TetR/AcrR family transcriptional regulator [Myxococcota bacterium]|nr:TetR/AcrR family transcriptional regulator [Myxococcota bacterium]
MSVNKPQPALSRRAATREKLRQSGLELFAERGLHGLTTHDIAHHAGLAAGTFYLHFPDKQALFREIVLEAMDELRAHLQAATAITVEPTDSVQAHATALMDFAARNRAVIRILFSGDGEAAELEHDVLNTLAESLAKARTERDRVPEGAAPAVFAQALVGMFARVVAWWVEDPSRATRDQVIETLTRIQLTGTQPD